MKFQREKLCHRYSRTALVVAATAYWIDIERPVVVSVVVTERRSAAVLASRFSRNGRKIAKLNGEPNGLPRQRSALPKVLITVPAVRCVRIAIERVTANDATPALSTFHAVAGLVGSHRTSLYRRSIDSPSACRGSLMSPDFNR